MNEQQFKAWKKRLALQVIELAGRLPRSITGQVLGKQIIRSATSVGANYRGACRAQSTAHIISKLSLVEEEADETLYWLELIEGAQLAPSAELKALADEYNQIVGMTVASIKTLRKKQQ